MRIALIIAAGGIGKRFGRAGGKQLFEYQDKPIIIHTIEKFIGKVDQLIIVIKENDIDILKNHLNNFNLKVDNIITGGNERHDSVKNGLAVVNKDIDYVMIHDGVRPNVSANLINRLKKALKKYRAVIPVVPVTDTIKIIKDNKVVTTPARSELYAVQTPQCFTRELITSAYDSVDPAGCTDDAMVVEKYGQSVYTIAGETKNIKITVAEDLQYLA